MYLHRQSSLDVSNASSRPRNIIQNAEGGGELPSDKTLETPPPLRIHHGLDLFRRTYVYGVVHKYPWSVCGEDSIFKGTQPRRCVGERWGFLQRHDGVPDGETTTNRFECRMAALKTLELRLRNEKLQINYIDLELEFVL